MHWTNIIVVHFGKLVVALLWNRIQILTSISCAHARSTFRTEIFWIALSHQGIALFSMAGIIKLPSLFHANFIFCRILDQWINILFPQFLLHIYCFVCPQRRSKISIRRPRNRRTAPALNGLDCFVKAIIPISKHANRPLGHGVFRDKPVFSFVIHAFVNVKVIRIVYIRVFKLWIGAVLNKPIHVFFKSFVWE